MNNDIKRPQGMSQLDYLWLNFGGRRIENEASTTPQEDVLLTEKALTKLIQKSTNGGITSLLFDNDPLDSTMTRLTGQTSDGSIITVVKMPKEVHVVSFVGRKATQADVDNGFKFPVGSKVLAITLSNEEELLVSLDELNLVISGGETDTIINEVGSTGVVSSNLKLDKGNNTLSVVKLKTSNTGLYATLDLSQKSSGVVLSKEQDGLFAQIPLGTTGYNIKFQNLTLAEYLNIPIKDPGTLYFISDVPYIFLGSRRYGVNVEPGDAPIVSLVYDPETTTLAYKRSDESDIKLISLGPASGTANGMMSKEQYIELETLKNALDGIVNVKDYVGTQVSKAAIKLEWGETVGTTRKLLLKNALNDILSTVDVDAENYLNFATSKVAEAEDVQAAAAQGVTILEGQQILILTLTSGDKVYVSLQDLVDVYTGRNTKSINVSISKSNEISADLNISSEDKMLYVYKDGLGSNLKVVRKPGKVIIYGKTQTEKDKLSEFIVGDPLTQSIFVKSFTADIYKKYPPRKVDGKEYDQLTNPLIIGEPYLIMSFSLDTGDPSTSFIYNDYLSLQPMINSFVLSPEKGNMLERDENGYLYCSLKWIDVQ